jgi:hypothetical protein
MKKALLGFLIVIFTVFLICLFQIRAVQAISLSLERTQNIYKLGDTIIVVATLRNEDDFQVQGFLECLLTGESGMYSETLVPYDFILGPSESDTYTLFEAQVTNDFPSDEYKMEVSLILNNIVWEVKETSFIVEGTLKEMEFNVDVFIEGNAGEESVVFIKGDNIEISFNSPVEGIDVEGTISCPNGTIRSISLPTLIKGVEPGSYIFKITASKEGYLNKTKTVNVAIIEEQPEIPFANPNQPPDQPTNISPSDGFDGVSLTPRLESSDFSDPDIDDKHETSHWQISTTPGDYTNPILDEVTANSELTSVLVPNGVLDYSTTYYWRVRHEDGSSCSFYSEETSFTTELEKRGVFPKWLLVTIIAIIMITIALIAIFWKRK